MVWLHDYGKLLDFEHQYEKTLTEGSKTLARLGFAPDFARRAVDYIGILDRKLELDLHEAPLEVQIVSSADAASHFVGPFMAVHWKENPDLSVEELMAKQRRKVAKDWDRKMVLPEVRRAFAGRRRVVLEQAGELPEKFLA